MKLVSLDAQNGQRLLDAVAEMEWTASDQSSRPTYRQRLQRNLEKACTQVLTPRQQMLVTMYFMQGMTMQEIAKTLQICPSTVSRTIRRAKRRLYDYLQYSL